MITLRKRKVFMTSVSSDTIGVKTKFIIEIKDEYGQFQPFAEKGIDLYHDTPEARNAALDAAQRTFQEAGCKVRVVKGA